MCKDFSKYSKSKVKFIRLLLKEWFSFLLHNTLYLPAVSTVIITNNSSRILFADLFSFSSKKKIKRRLIKLNKFSLEKYCLSVVFICSLVSVGILELPLNTRYTLILEYKIQKQKVKSLSLSADSILPRFHLPTASKTLDIYLY
eukprot:snap_masked-scaffold_7-processed-gene-1.37-mRNA-1 protein AED:1.00 eAED:1.00 QI:0/0/0/0/1/1/2/0/143